MSIKEQLLLCHHSCVVTVTFDTWSISLCIPPLTYTHTPVWSIVRGAAPAGQCHSDNMVL